MLVKKLPSLSALALAAVITGILSYAPAVKADTETFNTPVIRGGYRLDWCLHWARDCGRPAADEFCRRRGFRRALRFAIDEDIGHRDPTRIITSGRICDQRFCDGFRFITCVRPEPEDEVFRAPRIRGGYRLDWCLRWAADCGRPAADEFCRRRGFRRAGDFEMDEDIGHRDPTRIITSGRVCNQRFCDGFRYIRCIGRR